MAHQTARRSGKGGGPRRAPNKVTKPAVKIDVDGRNVTISLLRTPVTMVGDSPVPGFECSALEAVMIGNQMIGAGVAASLNALKQKRKSCGR